MPFDTNQDLPPRVRDNIPSERGKTLFRETVNSSLEQGNSENVAFATAWASLQDAGYAQNSKGEWVKKALPDASDVHVSSSIGETNRRRREETEKAEFQGREVELNKPFRLPEGSSKKFGVYVRDGDDVKRVTFGDPDMEIKRDDPEARENFRARFSCDEVTDKTSATYWSCRMWQADTPVSEVLDKEEDAVTKRQVNDDVYTRNIEAQARSFDLDLDGETHTYRLEDGQAVFVPGRNEQEYLDAIADNTSAHTDEMGVHSDPFPKRGMIARVVDALMDYARRDEDAESGEAITQGYEISGKVLKVDDDQRIVYGWASVISENGVPVVDTQGDVIAPEDLVEAVNDFMGDERAGKVMHQGERVGTIIHSLPLTADIAQALGIETEFEGWIIGYRPDSDEVLRQFKTGELAAFSIGGQAHRVPIDE